MITRFIRLAFFSTIRRRGRTAAHQPGTRQAEGDASRCGGHAEGAGREGEAPKVRCSQNIQYSAAVYNSAD